MCHTFAFFASIAQTQAAESQERPADLCAFGTMRPAVPGFQLPEYQYDFVSAPDTPLGWALGLGPHGAKCAQIGPNPKAHPSSTLRWSTLRRHY